MNARNSVSPADLELNISLIYDEDDMGDMVMSYHHCGRMKVGAKGENVFFSTSV